MISIFQKIFDLISSEEFCFLYVEPARDGYGISPSLSPLSSPPLPSSPLTLPLSSPPLSLANGFTARFLRANRSLREEKCSLTEGRLLIYPVSNFKTVTILSRYLFSPYPLSSSLLSPLRSLLLLSSSHLHNIQNAAVFSKGATKQGYLVKRSQAAKNR